MHARQYSITIEHEFEPLTHGNREGRHGKNRARPKEGLSTALDSLILHNY